MTSKSTNVEKDYASNLSDSIVNLAERIIKASTLYYESIDKIIYTLESSKDSLKDYEIDELKIILEYILYKIKSLD